MGILGDLFNFPVQLENLRMQREQQQYDRRLQQDIFAREDTAAQRAAADFEAAGLSKTLAAGNTAGAGPVVHSTAPQMGTLGSIDVAGAIKQMTDVAATGKQMQLVDAQKNKVDAEKVGIDLENQYKRNTLDERSRTVGIQNTILDLDKAIKESSRESAATKAAIDKLELELQKKYGASEREAKLAAQKIANEITAHNRDWYKNLGLPISPSGSADIWTKLGGVLQQLGGKPTEYDEMGAREGYIDKWIKDLIAQLQNSLNPYKGNLKAGIMPGVSGRSH